MSYYLTPLKQENRKITKSTTQNKAEDWVCVVCNNLNFSFRKKCNRCKTQTRSQNENHVATAYSHYYYDNINYNQCQIKSPLSNSTNLFTPQHKPKNQNLDSKQPKPVQLELNLSGADKPIQCKEVQTGLENGCDSVKKDSFVNQFWEFINVQDFDQIMEKGEKEKGDDWEEEEED